MRAEYNVREVYTGDGLTTAYTFDYKVVDKAHLLVLKIDNTGAVVWQVRGNDTTYFNVTLNAALDGGTLTLLAVLPLNYKLLILLADDEPTQPSAYPVSDRYTLNKIERSFDTLSGQIQRMRYLLDRALKFPEKIITAVGEMTDLTEDSVPVMTYDVGTQSWSIVPTPVADFEGPAGATGPAGPAGATGAAGPAGATGPAGADGTNSLGIHMEAADPTGGDGVDGDVWINSSSGDIFKKAAGVWSNEGNIRGPQGIQGNTGATGATGLKGDTGATGAQGIQGLQGIQGIQGVKGDPGSQIYTNAGDPNVLVVGGVQGDYYIDLLPPNDWYRFEGGVWVQKGSFGAGAGGKGGSSSIPNGAQSITVTLASPEADINYGVTPLFSNTVDTDPIFLSGMVTGKTINDFTVIFNAPTDSANYRLEWTLGREA